MPTTYKTLGQTTATAASATVVNNLITDPTLEALGNASTSNIANSQIVAWTNTNWRLNAGNSTNAFYTGINLFGAGNAAAAYAGANSLWAGNTTTGTNSLAFTTLAATTSTSYSYSGGNNLSQALADSAIVVSPSTIYYYGAYIRSSDAVPTVNYRVQWFDSSGIYISDTTKSTTASTSAWTKSSNSATSPSTATRAVVWIQANLVQNAEFGFDNAWFTSDSAADTTFPTPSSNTTNATLTAPFTKRGETIWSGTANSSTTISTFAGALTDLYTVPASTQTVVSTITATNLTTSATSCRVLVLPSGQTAAAKNFIVFDGTLPANTTEAYTLGITLAAGDKLQVASDIANVSFSAFGSEIS